MTTRLKVLLLEDNAADARLVLRELERSGFEVDGTRVDSEQAFVERLDGDYDLILADYSLPQFDAVRALGHRRDRGLDIPFIIITGTVGEEEVVKCMKLGASDYLIKDRLARLGTAVKAALATARAGHEQRRSERDLRESEARFRLMADTAPVMVWVSGPDGKYSYLNRRCIDFLGVEPGTVDDDSWIARIHDEDVARYRATVATALERRSGYTVEYRMRRVEGDYRWVLDTGAPRFTADEEFVGYIGSALDVTERKHLEEQFRQSQKMEAVGRLAGGVAHDFNNLLTVIGGYSEIAARRLTESDPLMPSLDEIRNAAARAATLTRQLLAFSRKQVLAPRIVNLNALVTDLLKMLERLIGEDIDLEFRPDGDLGAVEVDPGQMEQIVVNLIVNARDAMPQGGTIRIRTTNVERDESFAAVHRDLTPGSYVALVVSDTGHGMDDETLSHIFEPFFTTKGPEKGTGLGLSTVYGIVRQSRGHIWAYSEPGEGTTFKVYLPRVDGRAVTTKSTSRGSDARARGHETVLVVEDEDAVRTFICQTLEERGFSVLQARDGQDALDVSRAHGGEIDLLVTDMVMPRIGGRALVPSLLDERPAIQVLVMSGYSDDMLGLQALPHIEISYIEKPFGAEQIAAKVRQTLDRRTRTSGDA